jgi:hypothetical protein
MQASRLFLGFTLVVLVAAFVGLWQSFSPRPYAPPPPQPAVQAPAPQPVPIEPKLAEPTEPGVRSVYPGGRPTAPARPGSAEAPAPATPSAPATPAPAPAPGSTAAVPPDDGPVDTPANAAPDTPPSEGEIDLNSASLEALNGLGAGMIGKTIIANRPYASPDELVSRRVLKRQDYEIIKPRVVAR